ncbi:stress response translation initiation inhibitor YciH [Alteromonas oceanisediminis]|uniref:stress response translation initiation inhibitor YciH n=1 Tax=Alteromonas oceanisediminis TaxID=2836180 RepID=UPI001BDAA7A1|nr:stress response translation initiation inhibitor YciH [Alteromonas oceanisediminis]MBT0587544.1 stress response translation initiation inhibitor YciH [Alteromonas oceanisediminis]
MSNSRLVYSTDSGRIAPTKAPAPVPTSDGIVRIHKETKGRKGKGMSIIKGLPLDEKALKHLCSELKKKCGCGGSVKDFTIEIQGDVREKLKGELEKLGYTVKLAGG